MSISILPKNRIEGFIIDRVKGYILTDENMVELVKLTNEALSQAYGEEKEISRMENSHRG